MRKLFSLLIFCGGILGAQAQTFTNGLINSGTTGAGAVVKLGGTLTAATTIDLTTFTFGFKTTALPNLFNLTNNGKVGIGVVPTSLLHLNAGTAAVNTAPLKFTTGTLLATAEAGAMEFDATGLNFSPAAGTRKVLAYADLTNLSGIIPIAKGGTGASALTTGYIKSNGTVLSSVATVAGADVSGNITGNAANVTGVVAVANGGTGAATNTGVLFGNGTAATSSLAATAASQYLRRNALNTAYEFATITGGTGTVTGVSVATANGFAGTVATPTTTPAITITTNQTGLLKGNGTAILPAVAGTDFLLPTGSAAGLTAFPTLNQNTTGTAANVTGVVALINGGTGVAAATNVAALAALLPAQSAATNGMVLKSNGLGTTATSWVAATGTGTVTAIGVNPLNGISGTSSGGATPNLTISLGAITPASVAATGTLAGSNLSGTNTGDNAPNTLYSGLVTNATHTGDVTGATALTLATVNTNVGSFTNANITVNAKGLITAASNGAASNNWSLTGNGSTVPGTNFIGTIDAQRLVFKTGGVEKATILAGGNVGIGVVTPTSLLHLPLSGSIAIGTPDISTTEGAALSSNELRFRTNTNFNTSLAAVPGAYELQILDKNSATALGGIRANLAKVNSLYSMNNFIVANVLDGQLKVGGNGYGGVPFYVKESGGTPDFWANMVIEGSKTAAAAAYVPLNLHLKPLINVDNATTGISFGGNNIGGVDNSNASQAGIYVRSSNALGTTMKFATTNAYANGAQMRMTINPIGNVGIGTETPAAKLDIAGTIKITDGTQGVNKVLTSDANGLASWANAPSATSTAWGLQGNAGTVAGTNFIGTTDDQPLLFRLNNFNYGLFDHINNSNFLGKFAGSGSVYPENSNFLGQSAGSGASSASNSNFLGQNAGSGASGAENSNFLGQNAGRYSSNASFSNFLGSGAGNNATNANMSNFLGQNAGTGALSANNSNFLGQFAGAYATDAYFSNFMGTMAGNQASSAFNSNFLGQHAGYNATNASNSNFIGQYAGSGAAGANSSNFLGERAGINSQSANTSNFLGYEAGGNAANAYNSNFLGKDAGNSATNANNSNFLGRGAGNGATNASFSNFLGSGAGANDGTGSMGTNNIVIGTNISLPGATVNAMNIGGVLFGTDFHSNPYGTPSSVPIITGKIGIGTSTPAEKLDVMGSVYANDKIFIGTRGDGTAGNPALTPTQLGGNYKLFVNGSAIFTKAVVRLTSSWADYVFEPTYKLPTLSQVEAYITKHKHLEGVPSATEVKEKGIDLGDNQIILLKKVEELTLYMIELNKKVEVLAKENEELKKKVNGDK
jgi:hypothetical protein